jgi:hypothetical protein
MVRICMSTNPCVRNLAAPQVIEGTKDCIFAFQGGLSSGGSKCRFLIAFYHLDTPASYLACWGEPVRCV